MALGRGGMKRTHLPLNALRVLDSAARHLSFTRAAEELAVTPAAVGQQIRALEDLLGVILFRRTSRGLELTPEAERALPALRGGFERFEESVRTMQAAQTSNTLTLSVCPSFGAKWLAPRIGRFLSTRTDIRIHLFTSREPVDFTQENIDLAIRCSDGQEKALVSQRLLGLTPVVVATPDVAGLIDAPAFLVDPARASLIHDSTASDRGLGWAGWLAAAGVDDAIPDGGLHTNETHVALDAALAGQGVALVPLALAALDLASGRLVSLFDQVSMPTSNLGYHVAAPEAQWRQRKVAAFIAWLESEARDEEPQ